MTTEIKVPLLPESIADAEVLSWYKQPGDKVAKDEPVVDIETDKVVLEVPSPVSGILKQISENTGATVIAEQVIGLIDAADSDKSGIETERPANKQQSTNDQQDDDHQKKDYRQENDPVITPSAKKLLAEHQLDSHAVNGTGKQGRILKEDVLALLEVQKHKENDHININGNNNGNSKDRQPDIKPPARESISTTVPDAREEQRVPMTRLRARVAERLLAAQHNAAILTTFNEVNMQPVIDIRTKYKEKFEKTHAVKLGFMSFFIKATVEALKQFPAVNASIDGNNIVYHGYFDIGVAVSSPRGLVVPVLKDAHRMSMAEIEMQIRQFAIKAKDSTLSIDDITGGTFSLTNGGVFGSLLSTPILNPPQSGILGMHKIQPRPVAENGEIVIRPMMYLALSYDHRIIDGREAVQFLVSIKDRVEDPSRILLNV
jgi:2-oxoglutarate dehydrogenase E2 component (dihydrolipoamide succinyltransferase)